MKIMRTVDKAASVAAAIGLAWGAALATKPSYSVLMRDFQTLEGLEPKDKCGTGGLLWVYEVPNPSTFQAELLDKGWRRTLEGDREVFQRSFGWLLKAKGYAVVSPSQPGRSRISISFS